jgi:ParB family chromosome partitioning protein
MSEINKDFNNKKQKLGRGLGSLLGANSSSLMSPSAPTKATAPTAAVMANQVPQVPIESRIWQIAVEKLIPSKHQPRTHFVKEKLEELANSIRQNGILQPIVARKTGSGAFEIIAGERRWRAAQMAGLFEVPVILKTLSNKETLELAIVENIQREDLSPMEEAEAYQRLITEFSLTQQQAAERVGKDRATVANALRLLHLPLDVRELLYKGELSAGHCKVLLSLDDATKISFLAKKIVAGHLSVRKTEQEVAKAKDANLAGAKAAKAMETSALGSQVESAIRVLQDDLQSLLGTRVAIEQTNGKGRVAIYFYSTDELSEIVEKVKSGCRK